MAGELDTLLDSLEVPPDTVHRAVSSVRVVIRGPHGQEKMWSLESHLQNLKALSNVWMLQKAT